MIVNTKTQWVGMTRYSATEGRWNCEFILALIYLLDNLRSDGLAWTTPCGEAVKDDDVVFLESSLELGLAIIRKIVSSC